MKGYREHEILGKHFSCFYSAEDAQSGKLDRELELAASQGDFRDEGWRVRQDGSKFWADAVIAALRGQLAHIVDQHVFVPVDLPSIPPRRPGLANGFADSPL